MPKVELFRSKGEGDGKGVKLNVSSMCFDTTLSNDDDFTAFLSNSLVVVEVSVVAKSRRIALGWARRRLLGFAPRLSLCWVRVVPLRSVVVAVRQRKGRAEALLVERVAWGKLLVHCSVV